MTVLLFFCNENDSAAENFLFACSILSFDGVCNVGAFDSILFNVYDCIGAKSNL